MQITIYSCDNCGKRLPENTFPSLEGWYVIEKRVGKKDKKWHICSPLCMSSWVGGVGWPRDTVESGE